MIVSVIVIIILDIFGDNIKYLLILTTRIAVSVLAVSVTSGPINDGSDDQITLIATDIAAPANNVTFTQVVGTDEGRVFLVGDGQLFELDYLVMKKEEDFDIVFEEEKKIGFYFNCAGFMFIRVFVC